MIGPLSPRTERFRKYPKLRETRESPPAKLKNPRKLTEYSETGDRAGPVTVNLQKIFRKYVPASPRRGLRSSNVAQTPTQEEADVGQTMEEQRAIEILLKEHDVARITALSVKSVRRWRLKDLGPRYIKIGGSVRYRSSDLQAFLDACPTGGGGQQAPASRPASRESRRCKMGRWTAAVISLWANSRSICACGKPAARNRAAAPSGPMGIEAIRTVIANAQSGSFSPGVAVMKASQPRQRDHLNGLPMAASIALGFGASWSRESWIRSS